MASIARKTPAGGAARFRDGCRTHWQLVPSRKEAALGLAKATFCRRGDADAALETAHAERQRSGLLGVADDPATYAQWALEWLARQERRDLSRETKAAYRRNVTVHIVPGLGGVRVQATTDADVEAFAMRLLAVRRPDGTGLAAPYIRQILANCAAMVDMWGRSRPLPRDGAGNAVNPWRQADKVRGGRKRGATWVPSRDELAAWQEAMPPDVRVIAGLIAWTGHRGCEAWALRGDDITWQGKDPAAPLGPQLAALAALEPAAFDAADPVLWTARKLEADRTEGPLKNRRAARGQAMDAGICAALGAHLAAHPERDGWLFYNPRPPHGPMAYDADEAARLEREVARLTAEHITAEVPHGERGGQGTSQAALRYVLAAGHPVSTADVAAALGVAVNTVSAHLGKLAQYGKLTRGGNARRATWAPGPRAKLAVVPDGAAVGRSRAYIARELGISQRRVQTILARIPVQPGEPAYSLGDDGRVHPRERDDRPAALRGVRPAGEGELRLWTGSAFRRWLRIAAADAGVPLPSGQVTHTLRHFRASELLRTEPLADVAAWIGDAPATILRAYAHPVPDGSRARVRQPAAPVKAGRRLRAV